MATEGRNRGARGIWMLSLSAGHIEELRQRLAEKGTLWSEWQYKLHRGSIITLTPVTPWNPQTAKPDPSLRYMARHLRIVPSQPGPFLLEYRRHTERWEPLPCFGTIQEIADFIAADELGLCAPTEPPASATQA